MQVTFVTADDKEVSVALADVGAHRVLEGLPVRTFPVQGAPKLLGPLLVSDDEWSHRLRESP